MASTQTAAQGADPRDPVTARPLVIIGGGEHARVVADAARSQPGTWQLIGASIPRGAVGGSATGLPDLGDDAAVAARLAATPPEERPSLVLGFGGTLASRRRTASSFGPDVRWATIVHVTAWVSPSATIEPGAVVLAGAIVNAGAHVGAHAIVNSHAVVEHDVRVGAGSHLAPGSIVGGGATIGDETMIGLGAVVRDHVTIGGGVVVGMGAVVVADVADASTVVGVPARVLDRSDG